MPALRRLDLGCAACPPTALAALRAAVPRCQVAVPPLPPEYRREEAIRQKIAEEERRQRVWEGLEEPAALDHWWLDDARAAEPGGWWGGNGGGGGSDDDGEPSY